LKALPSLHLHLHPHLDLDLHLCHQWRTAHSVVHSHAARYCSHCHAWLLRPCSTRTSRSLRTSSSPRHYLRAAGTCSSGNRRSSGAGWTAANRRRTPPTRHQPGLRSSRSNSPGIWRSPRLHLHLDLHPHLDLDLHLSPDQMLEPSWLPKRSQ